MTDKPIGRVSDAPYADKPQTPNISAVSSAPGLPNFFKRNRRVVARFDDTPDRLLRVRGCESGSRMRQEGTVTNVKAAWNARSGDVRAGVLQRFRGERRHPTSGQRRFEIRRIIPARCAPATQQRCRGIAKNDGNSTLRFIGLRQWFYGSGSAGPPARQRPPASISSPRYIQRTNGLLVRAHGPRALSILPERGGVRVAGQPVNRRAGHPPPAGVVGRFSACSTAPARRGASPAIEVLAAVVGAGDVPHSGER